MAGKKPRLQEAETPQQADVIDLMARLRASLEGKSQEKRDGGKGKPAKRASSKSRKPAVRKDGQKRRVA